MKLLKRWFSIVHKGKVEGELNDLDFLSKYLLITRAVIDVITFNAVLIAGFLAFNDGYFDPLVLFLCLIGLLLMHSGADLFNDYFDYKNGLDTKDYFRSKYMPHPILDGIINDRNLMRLALLHFAISAIIAIYLILLRGPLILFFFILGLIFSYAYQEGPKLKYHGLGEISTLIVWGPLMIGGTYFAITSNLPMKIIAVSIAYGLFVMLILMGKHIDKYEMDKEKKVATLPVLLGLRKAKIASIIVAILAYVLVCIYSLTGILPIYSLLILISIPSLLRFIKEYLSEKPSFWHVGFSFWIARQIGFILIISLLIPLILKII